MIQQAKDERRFLGNLDRKNKKDLFYTKLEVKKIISSPHSYTVIAKLDNIPIGCGVAKIEKASKWNKYNQQGYLGMLYVDKKYRKKGVAKALQDNRINWLRSKGIKYITCAILAKNLPALKLSTKQGFKPRLLMMYKELA